jgi:hypothetical protein
MPLIKLASSAVSPSPENAGGKVMQQHRRNGQIVIQQRLSARVQHDLARDRINLGRHQPLPCASISLGTVVSRIIAPLASLCSVVVTCGVVAPIASKPGKITRNGKNILGMAAISGTRRAFSCESVAIAVWITRKSVHQYPNDSTNPSPIASPNHSTPKRVGIGMFHPLPGMHIALGSEALSPLHPPTFFRPISTSGKNPAMIRKNCNTSL